MVRLHLAGNASMTYHLKELEVRAEVVVQLIRELITRGFPGYANYNIGEVERRTRELFGGGASAGFVPKEVLEEIERSADARGRRRPT